MAQPAKFEFGNVFDGLVEDPEAYERNKEPTWTAEELEREKALAFANGKDAGRADALAGIEQRVSAALDDVMTKAGTVLGRLASIETQLSEEAKLLSIAVGKAIASELLAQSHIQEIEAIVGEALGFLTHQPHVVVRIHEDLLDSFRPRFEAQAEARGFAGKLIILGEPDLEHADCRIEWAEGGITRDSKALSERLSEIVDRYLAPQDPESQQDDLFARLAETDAAPHTTTEEAGE